jgi:hypothetical protein
MSANTLRTIIAQISRDSDSQSEANSDWRVRFSPQKRPRHAEISLFRRSKAGLLQQVVHIENCCSREWGQRSSKLR